MIRIIGYYWAETADRDRIVTSGRFATETRNATPLNAIALFYTYLILMLIGLRGPLTLRRRRGPSGLRPGMACTEHSTKRHTVTQRQTNRDREEKIQVEVE